MMRLFKKYISVNKPAAITYDEAFYQILRETARHPIVLLLILTISGVRHWDLIMNLLPVPV